MMTNSFKKKEDYLNKSSTTNISYEVNSWRLSSFTFAMCTLVSIVEWKFHMNITRDHGPLGYKLSQFSCEMFLRILYTSITTNKKSDLSTSVFKKVQFHVCYCYIFSVVVEWLMHRVCHLGPNISHEGKK